MNDNLRNYNEQPNAEVWQRIDKELRKGRARRQAIGAGAGVLLVVVAALVVLRPAPPAEQQAQSVTEEVVAMAQPAVQQIAAVQPAAVTVQPVQSRQQREAAMPQQSQSAAPAVQQVSAEQPAQAEPAVAAVPAPAVCPAAPVSTTAPAAVPQPARAAVAQAERQQPVASEPQSAAKSSAGKVQDTVLWVPNVFVPGSDDVEINTFRARLNKPGECVSNFKMAIFNRGGHQVYHTNDIAAGWDGTYKGQALPQASYVYIIYYTDKDKVQHQRKGTITLVR